MKPIGNATRFFFLSLLMLLSCLAVAHSETEEEPAIDWFKEGLVHLSAARADDAIKAFTIAIETVPHDYEAYNNRGIAWSEKGQWRRALEDFNRAIQLNDSFFNAYLNRGFIWQKTGQLVRALEDYARAIQLKPDHAPVYNVLAWVSATWPDERVRDGELAVHFAETALGLNPGAVDLSFMAVAYAEAGRFEEAAAAQAQYVTEIEEKGLKDDLAEHRERLAYMQAQKPIRDSGVIERQLSTEEIEFARILLAQIGRGEAPASQTQLVASTPSPAPTQAPLGSVVELVPTARIRSASLPDQWVALVAEAQIAEVSLSSAVDLAPISVDRSDSLPAQWADWVAAARQQGFTAPGYSDASVSRAAINKMPPAVTIDLAEVAVVRSATIPQPLSAALAATLSPAAMPAGANNTIILPRLPAPSVAVELAAVSIVQSDNVPAEWDAWIAAHSRGPQPKIDAPVFDDPPARPVAIELAAAAVVQVDRLPSDLAALLPTPISKRTPDSPPPTPPAASMYPYSIVLALVPGELDALRIMDGYRRPGSDPVFNALSRLEGRGIWQMLCLGSYRSEGAAQSAVMELQRLNKAWTGIRRLPYAVMVGHAADGNDLDLIEDELQGHGLVGYRLPDIQDQQRLLVGAFEQPEDSRVLIDKLDAAGFRTKVVLR